MLSSAIGRFRSFYSQQRAFRVHEQLPSASPMRPLDSQSRPVFSRDDRRCPQTFLVRFRYSRDKYSRGGARRATAFPSSARSDENRGGVKTCRTERIAPSNAREPVFIDTDRRRSITSALPPFACLRFFLPISEHCQTRS